MALSAYYVDDLARQIASTVYAILASGRAHGGGNVEYVQGVMDMARAQAVAYGIPWARIAGELKASVLETERQELIGLLEVRDGKPRA